MWDNKEKNLSTLVISLRHWLYDKPRSYSIFQLRYYYLHWKQIENEQVVKKC